MSTWSQKNIEAARKKGAQWAANAAQEQMPCTLDTAALFPPAGNLVEPILSQLERGGILVMALVSASPIMIENYSENLWGRDIRTLYNLARSDAEEFFEIVDRLELRVGTSVFPFEELQGALILARQGELVQPNAVIEVSDPMSGKIAEVMAVRDIVLYLEDETSLRKKSKPVRNVNRRVRRLVRDLKDTLNDHSGGIGLAAPQIDVHSRVVVVRMGGGRDRATPSTGPLRALTQWWFTTK